MILLILGAIVFIAGLALASADPQVKRFSRPVRSVGLIILLAGVLTACVVQIDAGEVGVKKLFGRVQSDVLGSGLHFINPLMEIQKLDIKTLNYTMSGSHDEGNKAGDDAIRVLTADG